MLKDRKLIKPSDFTLKELDEIFDTADEIIKKPEDYTHICDGKLLGSLFFEPSTRTRLSFESAMNRLGGRVVGFSEAASSSVSKGETLADTIKIVSGYTDIIVMRHPKEGAAMCASENCDIPLINAGDGGHEHPTQTLTDMLTIRNAMHTFSGLKIGLCGDLKFGRTVHSLLNAMSRYDNNEFYLISPEELKLPSYTKINVLEKNNIKYHEVEKLEEVMPELDILYMTRVQKERFFNEADYVRLKDSYILDNNKMSSAKKDMIVLHPLPRVTEIATEVDSDDRAWYFKQARFGMFVRMSLISKLLGVL